MTATIALPNELETTLRRRADQQHLTLEEIALGILTEALEMDSEPPALEEVVLRIKAMAPSRRGLRPATGSLAQALRLAPSEPDFDLGRWRSDWARAEREIHELARQNDFVEGPG